MKDTSLFFRDEALPLCHGEPRPAGRGNLTAASLA